jgi:hypothetical protein
VPERLFSRCQGSNYLVTNIFEFAEQPIPVVAARTGQTGPSSFSSSSSASRQQYNRSSYNYSSSSSARGASAEEATGADDTDELFTTDVGQFMKMGAVGADICVGWYLQHILTSTIGSSVYRGFAGAAESHGVGAHFNSMIHDSEDDPYVDDAPDSAVSAAGDESTVTSRQVLSYLRNVVGVSLDDCTDCAEMLQSLSNRYFTYLVEIKFVTPSACLLGTRNNANTTSRNEQSQELGGYCIVISINV